jgi:NAD(P)-dependent dehydrogenase (short-subunit alcohol dehydrogenase family)
MDGDTVSTQIGSEPGGAVGPSRATRTHVVTGSSSGIGKATRELLRSRGDRVIGIDLRGADIDCDLADPAQRAELRGRVSAVAPDGIDAVHAVAGVASGDVRAVQVNYFGAIATLEQLRPLLRDSSAPSAVVVTSFALLNDVDSDLVAAMHAGDEEKAIRLAGDLAASAKGRLLYPSGKRAVAEWVRRQSVTAEWAGAGIPLNAVAPGVIRTPITADRLASREGRELLFAQVPSPLNGAAEPIQVARLLAWLTSEENRHVTGQVIFADSGADAVVRGPHVFG